ncbi:MAG: DUF4340 domain-containing protein [Defluviitaleaceae bacterium]|nr:DUF4340 domain-containing protein [Defluviitaleaceae bacterium]
MKEKKGFISLAVAVLVVVGMVGLLFWQRNREPAPEEYVPAAPPQVIRLVDRQEAEVTKIVFADDDGTHTLVPYIDDEGQIQWRWEGADYVLHLPFASNKARASFNLFSNQIIHEDIHEVPDLRLEEFGFSRLVVTAHYNDGTTKNLYMGGPTPDFVGYFMMVEGNPGLYVISRSNGDRLLQGLEDMLCTALPFWDAETADYVLLVERGRDPIEFSRVDHETIEGATFLQMIEPIPYREVHASGFQHHIIDDFGDFRISGLASLHPADLSPYGLDDPVVEFIYKAFHGEAHLLFGDVFFRDVNGTETAFIYVKFADRPHVFEALYEPARALKNVNFLRFIDRFIALINIQDVGRIDITAPNGEFEVYINHDDEDERDIAPTINGISVAEQPFRVAYRLLVGLGIDGEVEPFTPTAPPIYTVTHSLLEGDDVVLHFYAHDDNFLAVSVDGEEAWFVTGRVNVERFLTALVNLM